MRAADRGSGEKSFACHVFDASDAGGDDNQQGNGPVLVLVVWHIRVARGMLSGKSRRSFYPRMSGKVPFFDALLEYVFYD